MHFRGKIQEKKLMLLHVQAKTLSSKSGMHWWSKASDVKETNTVHCNIVSTDPDV